MTPMGRQHSLMMGLVDVDLHIITRPPSVEHALQSVKHALQSVEHALQSVKHALQSVEHALQQLCRIRE